MPARSTTPAVTDRLRRLNPRWLLAPLAVAALVVIALGWRTESPPRPPAPAATPSPALVVGDGRTVTLLSLGGPETDALLRRVADDIGPAVKAVETFWGTDWSHDIVVLATANQAQFAAQAGAGGGARADTAAVAVADSVDPATRTVTGQRVVLAPGAAAMNPADLRIVLAHELFHYASRADTALDAPRWLTEGVADYVGRPAPAHPVTGIGDGHTLPSDAEFTGSPEQLSAAYDRAWLFARFVADRYGPPALRRLYLRVCGVGHADVPTALREVLGERPDAVLARWRQWAQV